MNATDVIGYTTSEGVAFCVKHNPAPYVVATEVVVYPIFACDTVDGGFTCDRCFAFIGWDEDTGEGKTEDEYDAAQERRIAEHESYLDSIVGGTY